MPQPKKKAKGEADEELVHIPRRKKRPAQRPRGVPVQTHLTAAQHDALTDWVGRLNISIAEYMRWLITDAVATRRTPPEPD